MTEKSKKELKRAVRDAQCRLDRALNNCPVQIARLELAKANYDLHEFESRGDWRR
jgi:hypothetical protein